MSTEIPLIMRTAGWVQVFPAIALLAKRNRSRPVLWIAGGALISFLGNYLGVLVANRTGNNHAVTGIFGALMTVPILWGLAEWQVTFVERLTARLFILPFLGTYAVLMLFVEDTTTFSSFTGPLYALTILGAATWTLLRRAFYSSTPISHTDWFWVAGGLALYGATTAVAQPIGAVLMADHRIDLLTRVWELRAGFVDLSFFAVVAGILTPPDPLHA